MKFNYAHWAQVVLCALGGAATVTAQTYPELASASHIVLVVVGAMGTMLGLMSPSAIALSEGSSK